MYTATALIESEDKCPRCGGNCHAGIKHKARTFVHKDGRTYHTKVVKYCSNKLCKAVIMTKAAVRTWTPTRASAKMLMKEEI